MAYEGLCLNCFSQRGDFDVCPYCGYVAGTVPAEGYILHPGSYLWGRYIIGTVLGTGGFGITYRAWDTRLSTMVAIKEFYPQSLVSRIPGESKVRVFSGDKQEAYAQQLARFMEEARNLAKFTGDAHIVNVLDYFEDNGTAYIVMEYLDGVTLKEYMARQGGKLPTAKAMEIAGDLLRALSTIHSKGIIHRDISPDNIFILSDGAMKVLDFGAARFAVREDSELTQGVVVKKGYAPPEQYRTNMKQGVWTDIYAAGATLYKMVTGITPEESIERTEKDVLKRPSQTGTAVDAAIDKTVMKAMALRPELRFKSADAMLAALENRTVIDFPEEELKKRQGRSRILIAVCVVLVVCLGALVAWQAMRGPESLVVGGPAINEDDIEADTITVLVRTNENYITEEEAIMTNLVEAFSDRFPQHTVNIETYYYDENYGAQVADRFLSADAPAVFQYHVPDLDQEENPYLADLSPLYASLNMADYHFLADYYEDEIDPEAWDGKVYDIPLGFDFEVAYVNPEEAEARSIAVPAALDDFDQLIAWESAMPGTVEVYPHEIGRLLGRLEPQIREDKDLAALEDYMVEYVDMYQKGYYQQGNGEDLEYKYSGYMVEFSSTYTTNLRDYRQRGDYTIVPLLTEGQIACQMMDYYGVSAHISENQQKLAMLFLRFAMSEYGQNIVHVQTDNGQPLHKAVLAQYVEANPGLEFLTGEYADKLKRGASSFYFNELYERLNNRDETLTEEDVRGYVRAEYEERWSS